MRLWRHKDLAGSYQCPRYQLCRRVCDNYSLKKCREGAVTTCIGKAFHILPAE